MTTSNYRPISLLSNLKKIFETLISKQVDSFLESNNIIYDLQFGFRRNHSTSHALISITEQIKQSLDRSDFACGIFVDFQKAFDTVKHDILLKKKEKLWHKRLKTGLNHTSPTEYNTSLSLDLTLNKS